MKKDEFKVISLGKNFYMKPDEYLNGWARKCGWKATLVYDSLCRHADRSKEAFPSVKLMAEEHGVSRDTIMRGIKTLIEYKIIKRVKKRNANGKFLHNTYYLLNKAEWKEPSRSQQHGSSKSLTATYQVAHSDHNHTHITKHITSYKGKSKKKYGSIKKVGEDEFNKISNLYDVPVSFVRSKYDDMINWHESTGKKRKDWYATLRNFVKKDALQIKTNHQNKSLLI